MNGRESLLPVGRMSLPRIGPGHERARHYVSQMSENLAAKHRHDQRAYDKEVDPNEVATAYGRRKVEKLCQTLAHPSVPDEVKRDAIFVLDAVCSTQENKYQAVDEGGCASLVELQYAVTGECRAAAAKMLAYLCTEPKARASAVSAGALPALCANVGSSRTAEVRYAAAKCLSIVCSGIGEAGVGYPYECIPPVVEALGDDSDSASAAYSYLLQTLAALTETEDGVMECLQHRSLPAALVRAGSHPGAQLSGAQFLRNMCQVEQGRVQAFERGGLPVLARLMGSADAEVRRMASGAMVGMTVWKPAKVAMCDPDGTVASAVNTCLHDTDFTTAENALAIIHNCAEHPPCRDTFKALISTDPNVSPESRVQLMGF